MRMPTQRESNSRGLKVNFVDVCARSSAPGNRLRHRVRNMFDRLRGVDTESFPRAERERQRDRFRAR